MTVSDIIIIVVLTLILGTAITYMKKEKERGVTCIGCPNAKNCAKQRNCEDCNN